MRERIKLSSIALIIMALGLGSAACVMPDGSDMTGKSSESAKGNGNNSGGGGGSSSPPPSVPVLSSTTPVSPDISLVPIVSGTSDPTVIVEFFSDSGCTTSLGSTISDANGDFAGTITVTTGKTMSVYAKAIDFVGGKSDCTTSALTYVNTGIGQGLGKFKGAVQTNAPSTPTNVNQATAYALQWPSSEFDAVYFDHSTSTDSHKIKIKTAGDYFFAFTLPMTSALQRANVRAEIRVNGSVSAGAVSECSYIRNYSGHTEGSDHFAVMVPSLSVDDEIEVYVRGTALAGTVTINSEATLVAEYVGSSRTIFAATGTQTTAGTNFNQAAAAAIEWTEQRNDSGIVHDDATNPEDITLTDGGDYMVYVNLPLSGTITRGNIHLRVELDDVVVPGGIAAQAYIRNASGHNESSAHWSGMLYNVTPNAVLTVKTIQEAAAGTMTVTSGYQASIMVEKVDSSSRIYFGRGTTLEGGSNNWNPASATCIEWTSDDAIDTSIYTHSTSVSPHEVTIDERGDYLLVYNDALTSTAQRPAPKITVEIDGSPVAGAEAKSHYIRASNGHNDSSASLVYLLRDVQAGEKVVVKSQQEALAATVNDIADGILTLIKKNN